MDVLTNISVELFKPMIGCNTIKVIKNPKTNKLFASTDNGKILRVEQAIDVNKPMVMLIPNGELENACLINEREGVEPIVTL